MSDKPFVVLDNDESDENVVDGNLSVSGDGNPSVSGDERPQRPLFPLNGVSIFGLCKNYREIFQNLRQGN